MMVVTDLDGTLLNQEKKVGKKEKEWIQQFVHSGNVFGVLTSRNMTDVKKCIPWIFELLNNKVYIGYDEGAHILGPLKSVHSLPQIAETEITKILKRCKEYAKSVTILSDNGKCSIVFRTVDYCLLRFKLFILRANRDNKIHYRNYNGVECWKIKLNLMKKEKVESVYENLKKELPEYTITNNENQIEIMHGRSGKKGALDYICMAENYKCAEVVYLGDEGNDEYCLKVTESYAMGNSPERIKRMAKHVTASNNDGGAYSVFNYIFKGE